MINLVKLRYSNTISGNEMAICYGQYTNSHSHKVHYNRLTGNNHTRNFSFSTDFEIEMNFRYET